MLKKNLYELLKHTSITITFLTKSGHNNKWKVEKNIIYNLMGTQTIIIALDLNLLFKVGTHYLYDYIQVNLSSIPLINNIICVQLV